MTTDPTEISRSDNLTVAPTTNRAPSVSLNRTQQWDRRIAWIVTLSPFLGTIAALVLLFFGYRPGPSEFIVLIVLYIATLAGIEVGFHRHFTHCSFKTYAPIRATLAILGSMAFEGPVIWWSAVHRKHHKFSDEVGDPHSPNLHKGGFRASLKGFFHAHMGWLFDPECTRGAGWNTYTPDLYRDAMIFRIHMHYFYWLGLGLVIPTAIGALAHRSFHGAALGFLWGGLVRIFLVNHAVWAINSISHRFGQRPFRTSDMSRNNGWLAIPTMGQAWHNNHHAFPGSAFAGLSWWQFDPSGWIIQLMGFCGMAWEIKFPSAQHIQRKRNEGSTPDVSMDDSDATSEDRAQ